MDDTSRRDFIRSFGVAFLAVAGGRALTGCRRGGEAVDAPRPADVAADAGPAGPEPDAAGAGAVDTGPTGALDTSPAPPPTDAPAAPEPDAATASALDAGPAAEPRARVREMWLALVPAPTPEDWAAMQGGDSRDPRPAREAAHRKALDELVALDDLSPPVADLVQLAFKEVSFHHWRQRIGATCYDPTQFGWQMQESRERLCERARLLDEAVRAGTVSAHVVDDSRAALARELAVYDAAAVLADLQDQSRWDKERELSAALAAGGLTPDADELKAAGWLVELLLAPPRNP